METFVNYNNTSWTSWTWSKTLLQRVLHAASSHPLTHYGYVVFRIDHDLTPSNTRLKLTILLCIQYYRHATAVAYTGLQQFTVPYSTTSASYTGRQQFSANQGTTSTQPSKHAAMQLQLRRLKQGTSPCCLEICRRLRYRRLRSSAIRFPHSIPLFRLPTDSVGALARLWLHLGSTEVL